VVDQPAPDQPTQDRAARPGGTGTGAMPSRLSWELLAFAELSALCGLAVAQPLLDSIGRSPDFLLFHGAGTTDALLLVAAVVLGPPLALWGLGAAARLAGDRARRAAQAVLVGAVFAAFAVQVGKHLTPVRGVALAALAAFAGAGVAVAYARLAPLAQVLRVAAIGPLVFVLLFVFTSPASAVVLSGGDSARVPVVAGKEIGPHPPIVVIVLDELPLTSLLDVDGQVDGARLPNFARLADGSTWYRNATAVSPHTTYAVPSMLTGRYPSGEVAPHYSTHPENLFTLLGGVYDIQAWETITQLCPPQLCRSRPGQAGSGLAGMVAEAASLLGRMASPYDSAEDPTAGYREQTVADDVRRNDRSPESGPEFRMSRLAENQPSRFTDFLAALAADRAAADEGAAVERAAAGGARPGRGAAAGPPLRFLHLLIPHSPWLYLPSGVRYDGSAGLPFDGRWWARLAHQRHLQQVAYADRLLGQALRALRDAGLYDDSLVVVTSDHGDSFSDGVSGRDMDAGQRAAAEIGWVPLFVKEPGQTAGRVDDRNWQHVDLLPTLADYAGVQVPWAVDGRSARGEPRPDGSKRFDQKPGTPMTLDAAAHLPDVLRGPAARPVLPEMPQLAITGRPVRDFLVTEGGPPVTVANGAEFADVRPDSGKLPALVDAGVPQWVPEGTPVAIAVNGRVGAVALACADHAGRRRVVGLVTDETLFVSGYNRLEFFEVTGRPGAWGLTRMTSG
jgi:hypothetical protein